MPCGRKMRKSKMNKHKRKKRLRKNRQKNKSSAGFWFACL